MLRRLASVAVLVALLLSALVPSSLARATPAAVSPASGDAVGVPPALAHAGIAPDAWGRIVDQIHAQQTVNGCSDCEAGGPTPFSEQARLVASDGAAGDDFGFAVAIWGDTVVVGAYVASPGDNFRQGAAWVFGRNTGGADNWGEIKKLTASDGAEYDYFGVSVAIWGDTIVVGACEATVRASDQGAAYVFARNTGGADNWGQVKKLTASDAGSHDFFGRAVAVWGDTVVVGAWFDDAPSGDQGSAYVFGRNTGGANNWGQVKKLTASDGASYDYLGLYVAAWGDTVVVGAYAADVSYVDQGAAYVFERNAGGVDNWGQVKRLVAADGLAADYFGVVVAIYGDTIVAGASGANVGSNSNQGAAYVFERNTGGADNWGQVQKLTADDGAAGDSLGFAASIWGDRVVVGAYQAGVGGNGDQGAAYVYRRNTGGADNWGQTDKLFASDGEPSDFFGWYVDIWGDTVVVGAYGANVGVNGDQGASYIFTAPCTPDSELTRQTASDGASSDWFGYSVAISGDTVVVGANYADVGGKSNQGVAYVFYRNSGGADLWGQVAKLTATDGAADDYFGASVAICGDTVVVGAYADDEGIFTDRGSAYVFYRNQGGADAWGQVAKLAASDAWAEDYFGRSVAISGDTVVVGAYAHEVGPTVNQGSAYIFYRNQGGADAWGQAARLTASDGGQADNFGWSVAISGDTVVVGADTDDVGTHGDQGSAYVFYRNSGGADLWGQVAHLTASGGAANDYFGYSVAISGDTVVVGALLRNAGTNINQGAAYVFRRNSGGADLWGQVAHLTASDGAQGDRFGYSVAICGDTLVVGAYWDDPGGNANRGSAYLFYRNEGGADNWGQVSNLTASDGAAQDYFGGSVAIFGDTVVVGAYLDDVGGNADQGSAYLYGCGGTTIPADVAISKTSEPELVHPGDVVTYTLAYSNPGLCATGAVTLCDTTQPGLTPGQVASIAPGWTPGLGWGNSLGLAGQCWYTPSLSCGEAGTIVLTSTVDMSYPIASDWVLINTATITTTGDLTPTNNLSQASVIVQGLEIRKSHFPATVTAAWDFWLYVDVTNTASSPATNVVVTDTLPVGVAAYSVQPDSGGVFDGVSTVIWNIPSIGPNSTVRLTVKARTFSTQAGNCLTNNAVADSEQAAPSVWASDTICVVKGELARPTPTPTPAATPVPPGTTVTIKKGGPGTSLDTYIYRNQPYSNYWLEPLLKVGYKQTNASLIQFDLSPIPPGAKVDEAWLEVWAAGWSGPFSDITIGAYAISETVQISQTTWVSPELGTTWGLAGANDIVLDRRAVPESTVTTSGPLKWYRFDVSKLVQEWLDSGTANNGAMLRCESCAARVFEIKPVAPDNAGALAGGDAREPVGLGPLPGNLCTYTFFFASSENPDPALWPRLVVRYE